MYKKEVEYRVGDTFTSTYKLSRSDCTVRIIYKIEKGRIYLNDSKGIHCNEVIPSRHSMFNYKNHTRKITANKLSRKLYSNYEEKDGYLIISLDMN